MWFKPKVCSISVTVVLVFVFQCLSLFVTASPQNFVRYETCSWFYRGNPEDCNTYFQCNHGAALLRNCAPGLFWNVDIGNCDWPRNVRSGVDCRDTSREQSQEIPDNTGSGGFDHNNRVDGSSDDTVVIDPEIRSNCQEGSFLANPSDCGTFFLCNHGVYRVQQCGPGLHWNTGLTTCDWPSNAHCQSSGSGTPPVTDPPTTPSTTLRPVPTATTAVTGRPTTRPTTAFPSGPAPSGSQKVICYFTDWAWYRPGAGKFMPEDIDPNLCTHVIYAFAILRGDTYTITPADSWADMDNKFYERVTALKKLGVKVSLALGGWNDSGGNKYSVLVNDPNKRRDFIASVVSYLSQNNFDGIDIDWEYPKCWQGNCDLGPASDRAGFTALISELRAALPNGIISAAVSANKNVADVAYDVPSISRDLDWIGVMDYDFHGGWEKQTGHIAPLYYNPSDTFDYLNVNYSVNYFIQKGAPPSKLVVGVPLYGQSFTLANVGSKGLNAPATGPGIAGEFTRQGGILSYYEICSTKWDIFQDPKGTMGPYAVNGNQWVSFDDAAMVRKKAEYIKSMRLGGAMVWALDFDDFSNTCKQGKYPLLTALYSALKSRSRP